ncbi:MAG: hypothetical protein A2580_09165 [Hydrogenophilales bacterium RIFOXYD1_FULL_62_11]|nr:MAG: hypothetical protein A2580_09165 [Hydrogenophilales bacterium RIFOXYD1_FULL_62_11]
MNTIKAKIAVAFAGSVPGVESAPHEMVAYDGQQNHPLLPRVMDTFRFNKDLFMTLGLSWNREWSRSETDARRGVWIGGPKGAGKTTAPEQFFARLGVPVLTLTCNRRVPLSDYISKMVPDGEGGWINQPGPLVIAMQEGYPVVLNEPSAMDEADLIAMHDIIDRGLLVTDDGTVVKAKRGFLVYAADNTMGYGDESGGYVGTNVLNSATMRRFFKFEIDYPNEAEEVGILQARFPNQVKEALSAFVKFANMIRAPYNQRQSQVTMSTGELIEMVEAAVYFDGLSSQGRSPAWFAFNRIMGGMPPVEMEAARSSFQACFQIDVSGQ